jgi:FkbM family methyltransferase
MAKVLYPTARIIAIEPILKTFEILKTNMFQWRKCGIECYNIALGNGSPMSIHERGGQAGGMNRCYSDKEKSWWKEGSYTVESKTLGQMFRDYKIDISKPYMIKIDCEGGERFLLQDEFREESLKLIRGSIQTAMEIHMGLGGNKDQWNLFIEALKETHNFKIGSWKDKGTINRRYSFDLFNRMDYNRGMVMVEFVKKEFDIKKNESEKQEAVLC